jgi:hypothetical protein
MTTLAPELTSDSETRHGNGPERRWQRLARSGGCGFVVLTVLYFGLSLLGSADAYLSTDTGGKTGALAAMVERDDWSTDLGYWAELSDPEGLAFPFAHTTRTENGWWVNTTSLPMVLAARPLWVAGGAQLALLIPMMAAAGAAVVAGRIQRRLDAERGTAAMWIVGLSTPLAVYALDFWEHSVGVFLMALGVLGVLNSFDVSTRLRAAMYASGAGLAFGFAATMRQEALVYGFVSGVVFTIGQLGGGPRRSAANLSTALIPSAAMAFGAVGVLYVNDLVEAKFYGSSLRAGRSVGTVAGAASGFEERVNAGFTIALSPINAIHPVATFFGLLILAGLVWLMITIRSGGAVRLPATLLIATAAILALRIIRFGPTFVPGMVPAAPLVIAGAFLGTRTRQHRTVVGIALGALPLIFLTQYPAGAVPQWGGRYVLLTGFLLVIVSCAELPRLHAVAFRGLLVAGVLVTASGVWFNAVRTTSLEDDFELIETVADGDVVVWYDSVKAREGGPEIVEHRWLSTVGDSERSAVLSILADESIDRFVYVDQIDAEVVEFEGFEAVSEIGEWELSPILRQRLTIFARR